MIKRIILFSYDYPPSNGGIARLCYEIVKNLNVQLDIEVLTLKKGVIDQNFYDQSYAFKVTEVSGRRVFSEVQALNYLRKIPNKSDVAVICGVWHPEALISYISGFKNVYILGHGTEFLPGKSKFRENFWIKYYSKLILKRATAVICNSDYTGDLVKKISKDIAAVTLPLAVDEKKFASVDENLVGDKLKICSISRLVKFKGHDFIINVLSKMESKYLDQIELEIAGKGNDLDYLKDLVNIKQLENVVTFQGFISDSDLPAFYSNNNLFILCSRESNGSSEVEGFGLVFLEAQSSGIPVIGTKTGGIPDAIEHGYGGWLINQDNENELEEILKEIIDNKVILTEQGRKARTRVENNFTWDKYTSKLLKILNA